MVGLEQGDEAGAAVVLDFAEADEGVHLVGVAADLLGQPLEPVEQGVGAVLHRVAVGAQLEQHRVEQGEALGVADGRSPPWPGRRTRAARRSSGRAAAGRRPAGEQVGLAARDLPDDRVGRDAGLGQPARGIAPAVEIILGGEGDAMRVDHRAVGQHRGSTRQAANSSSCLALGRDQGAQDRRGR